MHVCRQVVHVGFGLGYLSLPSKCSFCQSVQKLLLVYSDSESDVSQCYLTQLLNVLFRVQNWPVDTIVENIHFWVVWNANDSIYTHVYHQIPRISDNFGNRSGSSRVPSTALNAQLWCLLIESWSMESAVAVRCRARARVEMIRLQKGHSLPPTCCSACNFTPAQLDTT